MADQWSQKSVLVTGAGGFIGSHLTEALVKRGAKVRAFIRYTSRADIGLLKDVQKELLNQVEVVAGDLRDPMAVRQAVSDVDIVFHLGALVSIPYSYLHPVEVAETNMMGTLNVLMACKDGEIKRLLHTSTSEVYGTARRVPIDEEHPLQGQSPYSASKIGADKLAESFFNAYDLPVTTVRPFNTYGPRQSARAVIPTIITQALTLDEIHLGNMNTFRDFTFVSDTVNGFIRAAEADGIEGQTINLGTGKEVSIRDLTRCIIELIDRPLKIIIDADRLRPDKSEVMRLLSDNSKARSSIMWQPEVDLEKGLEKTIDWIKHNLEKYRIGIYEY